MSYLRFIDEIQEYDDHERPGRHLNASVILIFVVDTTETRQEVIYGIYKGINS